MTEPAKPISDEGGRPLLPWERAARQSQPATDDSRGGPQAAQGLRPPTGGKEPSGETHHSFQGIKSRIHRRLLERLNLSNLDKLTREQVTDAIRKVVLDLIGQESVPLNFEEREELVKQVLDEIFGLGPIQPLIEDPDISDVMVNTWKSVFIERNGKIEKTDVRFQDDRHLLQVIDRIVSAVGRRIDDSSPMVDARLPDGSRVNAIIKPLAIDGPHLSIRKFKRDAYGGEDLIRMESLTEPMLEMLRGIVRARLNVLISGGTGAGKTTLLNILSSFIPANERILTIEDSAELQLRQPHVVRLETRPANIEGEGEVPQRLLLVNALRMRPDRIIMGECRGAEAVDMLQAMNTGHDGSITTLHANSPRDALSRLETMISMASLDLPEKAMRQQIASAIQVVIQAQRLSDGTRKISSISEIVGMEGDVITMQEIFAFERMGMDENDRVIGRFKATGIRPRFTERLKAYGIDLSHLLFSNLEEQKKEKKHSVPWERR
ncbi:MAG TPA: CpaF family protein [Gemmatimonadales bacterium]|jgi:pilus assembly protein CpaF|nr:CpaF family protein [Gemmatimonadales bacterium]